MSVNIIHITRIDFNWFTNEEGEDFYSHKVGQCGVKEIRDMTQLEKDGYEYQVFFENGKIESIFNVNKVVYERVEKITKNIYDDLVKTLTDAGVQFYSSDALVKDSLGKQLVIEIADEQDSGQGINLYFNVSEDGDVKFVCQE